jgi:signal peptidase I
VSPNGTGDIYIAANGDKTAKIARKKADKVVAMLQDVHDNDYVPTNLLEAGWPSRWQNSGEQSEAWVAENGTRDFATDGSQKNEVWLRYHHLLPQHSPPETASWTRAEDTRYDSYLIRDFYAYNTGEYTNHRVGHGENWVGDLALECEVEVRSDRGELVLELVKGGRKFQARIDVGTGDARLVIPGLDSYQPAAKNVIDGAGTYAFRFANIDEQLWLFVDDEPIEFDGATTYEPLDNYEPVTDPQLSRFGATDLAPAGIASNQADVRVSHLRIKRDLFYTRPEQDDAINEIVLADKDNDELDQFFMLGDNSPASKDGRMWGPVDYVERRLLIGKAIYIYWPHGIPASFSFPVNLFGSKKYLPFWPNVGRMERVR